MTLCDRKTCEQALADYLDKRALERKTSPGPQLVCWEQQADKLPIRLSFSIKVF